MGKKHQEHEKEPNHERWLVSYADFITLLFATFVALYAMSKSDSQKAKAAAESMRFYFGYAEKLMIPQEALDFRQIPAEKASSARPRKDQKTNRSAKSEDFERVKGEIESFLLSKGLMGKVQVEVDARGLVISLKEAGFFASGRADVEEEALGLLQEVAGHLREYNNPVRVEGHTDDLPIRSRDFPSNWELSTARATRVLRFLVERYGLDARRASALGFAQYRPLGPNDTPAGRARNRRVDIVFLSEEAQQSEP